MHYVYTYFTYTDEMRTSLSMCIEMDLFAFLAPISSKWIYWNIIKKHMRNWNEALHDIFQFDGYVVYFWQNRNNLWFAKYSTNCQYSAEWNISWYMYSTFLLIKFRILGSEMCFDCGMWCTYLEHMIMSILTNNFLLNHIVKY